MYGIRKPLNMWCRKCGTVEDWAVRIVLVEKGRHPSVVGELTLRCLGCQRIRSRVLYREHPTGWISRSTTPTSPGINDG
jgi:hypothetical protein